MDYSHVVCMDRNNRNLSAASMLDSQGTDVQAIV